jgi:hypothetical protein
MILEINYNKVMDRGIITDVAAGCLARCDHQETSQHLFIFCGFYGSLWQAMWSWLGVSGPDSLSRSDHFYPFTHSTRGLHARRSFLQLVWLLSAWTIWNDHNHRLFHNGENFIAHLLDKVKHYSLWRLKTSNANFVYGFTSWSSSPLLCLGVG